MEIQVELKPKVSTESSAWLDWVLIFSAFPPTLRPVNPVCLPPSPAGWVEIHLGAATPGARPALGSHPRTSTHDIHLVHGAQPLDEPGAAGQGASRADPKAASISAHVDYWLVQVGERVCAAHQELIANIMKFHPQKLAVTPVDKWLERVRHHADSIIHAVVIDGDIDGHWQAANQEVAEGIYHPNLGRRWRNCHAKGEQSRAVGVEHHPVERGRQEDEPSASHQLDFQRARLGGGNQLGLPQAPSSHFYRSWERHWRAAIPLNAPLEVRRLKFLPPLVLGCRWLKSKLFAQQEFTSHEALYRAQSSGSERRVGQLRRGGRWRWLRAAHRRESVLHPFVACARPHASIKCQQRDDIKLPKHTLHEQLKTIAESLLEQRSVREVTKTLPRLLWLLTIFPACCVMGWLTFNSVIFN